MNAGGEKEQMMGVRVNDEPGKSNNAPLIGMNKGDRIYGLPNQRCIAYGRRLANC